MSINNYEDNNNNNNYNENNNNNNNSNKKRSRNEITQSFLSNNEIETSNNINIITTSSTMRLNYIIDELKLQIEELNNKINEIKDENIREKEKYLRQLQFLDNENNNIKNELNIKNEKYYNIKKKYQSLLRTVESNNNNNNNNNNTSFSGNNNNNNNSILNSSFSSNNNNNNKSLQNELSNQIRQQNEQIINLEQLLLVKNNEIKNLKIKNSEYEEKYTKLEQNLLLLRIERDSERGNENQYESNNNNNSSNSNNNNMRNKINELETTIRKQNKVIEKYEKDLKNQIILEQELASSNTQIMQLKNSIKLMTEYEVKYNLLIKEKENYFKYFQNIIKQLNESKLNENNDIISFDNENFHSITSSSSSSSSSSTTTTVSSLESSNISPILIFKFLSNLQKKCILLLNSENNLENKNSELKVEINNYKNLINEKNQSIENLNEEICKLNKKINLLTKESILYENEVVILREVLKTFDSEFNLIINNKKSPNYDFKVEKEIERYFNLKEEMLTKLRSEYDEVRNNYKTLLHTHNELNEKQKLNDLNNSSDSTTLNENQNQDQIKQLKEKCREYEEEIFALQSISRIDFIPHKTKILHLKNELNPSYSRYFPTSLSLSSSSTTISSIDNNGIDTTVEISGNYMTPIDELRKLKKDIKSIYNQQKSFQERFQSSTFATTQNEKKVEEKSSSSSSTTTTITTDNNGIDFNKLNLRLKEMFREKISIYREAIYLLFGFKVDLLPSDNTQTTQLRLKSMYAENADDSLLFQMNGKDEMNLLETPFASQLDESIIQILHTNNSIPIFLSNVTLDLFEKQTFMG